MGKPRNEEVNYRIWKGDKVFAVGQYNDGEKSGTILYIYMFERIVVPLPDFVIDRIWTRIVKANQDVIRKFYESAKQVKELGWPESKIDPFSDKNTFKNIIDTGSTIPDTEINYQKCLKGADTKTANKKSYADEVMVKVSKWMENELGNTKLDIQCNCSRSRNIKNQ